MIDFHRVFEVALILLVSLAASAARVVNGIITTKDYAPEDPVLYRLWKQRMRWAIAGEIAAVVLFVLLAETIVILRNLPGPWGVMIGAMAALLGFPFIAGIVRRRVAKKFEELSQ